MQVSTQAKLYEKPVAFLFAWILALLPIVIAAVYVCRIIVDVPIFDEWGFLPMIEKWHSGHGQWADLFAPHAEFNYLLPLQRAAALVSLKYFHWDIRIEIVSGFVFLLGTAMIFILYAKRIGALSRPFLVITYLLPVMLLLFALRQWENLIGPWGINFFGNVFFVMGTALWLTSSKNFSHLAGAMFFAIFASLSYLNGLAIWPIGLLILIIQRRKTHVYYWIVAGLIFFSIFFGMLYKFPPNANIHISFGHVLERFLAVLGDPLSMNHQIITHDGTSVIYKEDADIAKILGFILLFIVTYLFWKIRKNWEDFTFPLMGVLFSMASCLMLSWARGYHDVNQAFTSHYATFSVLLLACLVVLIVQMKLMGMKIVYLEVSLWTVILLSSFYGILTECFMMNARHAYLSHWAVQIKTYHQEKDLKDSLSKEMIGYAERLDRMKLSLFHKKFGD